MRSELESLRKNHMQDAIKIAMKETIEKFGLDWVKANLSWFSSNRKK